MRFGKQSMREAEGKMESPLRRHRLHGSRAETTSDPQGWQALGRFVRIPMRQSGSCLRGCRHLALLKPIQALIQTASREQLAMRPALANLTVMQHENLR